MCARNAADRVAGTPTGCVGWSAGMSTTTTPRPRPAPTPLPFGTRRALAQDIELRWQDWWDAHHTFETPNPTGPLGDPELAAERGEKLFVLDMFPYPSGIGLHVGHPLGFIGTDVYARFKRMTGHNVLHTMGFDAFGLPAEQYAVETGQHPRITTEQNVANYRRQLRRLGLAHDPRRSVSTTDPSTTAGRSGSSTRSSTPGTTPSATRPRPITELVSRVRVGGRAPTPDGRPWAELSADEQRDVVDDHASPTSARHRSTGARASARSSPTRRSPPTAAPTAATSRCSSATCASG